MNKIRCALACGILAASALTTAGGSEPAGLITVAESNEMIWNAVAVDGDRVFVAGPRWTGGKGPPLAMLDESGDPQPYPDEAWNAWKPGVDPRRHFVNINAIHRDTSGGLWAVDTGAPVFGADPLPRGAKLVRIELASNRVDAVHYFGPEVALPGSYIDDIRFNGDHAYLTDAGRGALIVLNLRSGQSRRILDGASEVTAQRDRPIVVSGSELRAPDGTLLRVNADPLEVSPDGRHLCFGTLHGPWFRIETRYVNDPSLSGSELRSHVEPWEDLPPVGGTAMAADGSLYFTELATNSLKRRRPDGSIVTVLSHPLLHWVDAPVIAGEWIWLPVPQIDRVALFNRGRSRVEWPVRLYRYYIGENPSDEPAVYRLDDQPAEIVSASIRRQYFHGSQSTFVKWTAKAGAVVPQHQHPSEQVTWIVEGEAEVRSQGRKILLRAGDILIIPPNVPH